MSDVFEHHRNRNVYDKNDFIRREGVIIAGGLKVAAYRVRDPETGEFGPLQYHMTYNNCVMAVMSESAAKLFCNFVTGFGQNPAEEVAA